ncbi:hypothetical protein COCCADRAFT_32998 [Bipolaris zeicola 26-R-13]|uniref:Uncharacterized protein n=1 Tax=Cochliobolus carbonum (strain 26-R-13) TaxID=930089 RepID=W6YR62_COCC2|nr:uncharacterized protein COCCADRAFT_32998 [Bipolaris zeicola 26-R-13]EUC37904.1 hypothetical protein COCCADRAFT_32998 [Bipolaris zeicola 26-R-13]
MAPNLSDLPKDYYVKAMQFTKRTHQDAYPAIDPSLPEHSLAGKVVIITGASRGIGATAMVPAFIKAGVKGMVLVASNATKLSTVEASVKEAHPEIETLTCAVDISDAQAVEKAFESIKQKFGHADILINAAGVLTGDGPKLHETNVDEWWKNFEVNAKGTYLQTRSFLSLLPSSPTSTPATILTLSSWQSFFTVPAVGGYLISKFAVDALAAYVAAEYPCVTSISMHPGMVATDMLREPFRSLFNNDSAELVGGMAVWVCQEKARWLSGRFVSVNWDVEDLMARKGEVVERDLLRLGMRGEFGV